MEWNLVLLILVGTSGLMNLAASLRSRPPVWGYAGVAAGIMAVTGGLYVVRPGSAGLVGGGLLLTLIVVPGLLQRLVNRWALRQRFDLARWPAALAGVLHPFDGVRQQATLVRGLDLIDRGETAAAEAVLRSLRNAPPRVARSAFLHLCRMGNRWPDWIAWADKHVGYDRLRREPALVGGYVRALGEVGRLGDMLQAAAGLRLPTHPVLAVYRAMCRLSAFAFAGQPGRVAELLDGPLAGLPAGIAAFWLATADQAAGDPDAAAARLAAAEPTASPGTRSAMAYRLARPVVVASTVLTPVDHLVLDQLHRDAEHEERYLHTGRRARPWVTWGLVAINVAVFAVEWQRGGPADGSRRYERMLFGLGAISHDALAAGQYWRLVTANFLHYGSAHVVLNMVALLALGPTVERSLGRAAFAAVYLASGVAALATAAALMAGPAQADEFLVGASGAIMAMVGASAAVLARGWLRERAAIAARRLRLMVAVVLLQAAVDYFTPQVSGTAHLAGAAYGFVLASLVPHRHRTRDRPVTRPSRPPAVAEQGDV